AGRLGRAAARLPERPAARLSELAGRLHALSPLGVIGRGYSVLRTGDGRVVRTTADAPPGSELAARTGDGWLTATVTGARRQRLDEPDEPYRA
ncbi:MAG: exodeoxyribonuclease large subunit, partial [Planctomycetota bacterium]